MILDEKVDSKNKGIAIEDISEVHNQAKDTLANHLICPFKSSAPESYKTSIIDGVSSDLYDNDYMDFTSDDYMEFDEYALQAHFDNVDFPPGVEAPVLWLLGSSHKTTRTLDENASTHLKNKKHLHIQGSGSSQPADVSKNPASVSNSGFQITVDSASQASGADTSSSWSLLKSVHSMKQLSASQHGGTSMNPTSLQRKKMTLTSSGSTNYGSVTQLHNVTSIEPPELGHYTSFNLNNLNFPTFPANTYGLSHPSVIGPSMSLNHPSVIGTSMSWFESPFMSSYTNYTSYSDCYDPFHAAHILPEGVTRTPTDVNKDDILRKYQLFKKFDTVEDHSDHHYTSKGYSTNQPPKNWSKRIQEEWRILENDLPDTIYVRVYESRMDLLRAVIIGAEGTPYHDGLFFFDVFFPSSYPSVPPLVYYHSGGLRLNPNLYSCGKVCLSLLGTWHGKVNERWLPGVSTVLQVLVSIQALILNQKPFFNEPGYEYMSGSRNGEIQSQQYNENTFMLSLRTMVYTMRRPPKHFEDFVLGHFHKYANDILVACKAYMDGAQVGCLVKGGVQDVDEGDKSCSKSFKDSLPGCIELLLKEFSLIGVKNTDKFQNLAKVGNNKLGNFPKAALKEFLISG
ncbi:probable ubiquitin-conjugating enzyme E2 26 isoform X3 [Manihot esculenta]|uniref:E2 ubiquitin-conjugating enzyme n=2 Tax=Manihot esculenta TaxID=3983 RepID=A0A251LAC7_MANES|nr:probable ubiquitin-conjugating enzyme E2 26 isoform X3 [Manihot esculenta]XP_043810948.1 probable ubiquitin-conjugating enzyme E2 26 isoform X3 [Manihot esculenta]OAY54900.1 hypothetical protein MANES_03G110600v8 [Manihot esculenta]